MRLFIAIELPDAARAHLQHVQEALRPHLGRASMTRGENLHLTVKFLGEIGRAKKAELCESLTKVKGPQDLVLVAERIEAFPERGPVRIIAAGIVGAVGALVGVQQAIEQRCRFLGFEREGRAYRPHVTLARARPTLPGSTREVMTQATHKLWPGPTFAVSEFVLMQSVLKPQGSEYAVIGRFPFAGS